MQMMKKAFKVVSFLLVCTLCLGGLNGVFKFKYGDGIESLQTFYEQPKNSVDVLCLGSSRTFENINTGVLWDEWGMAAYDLAGSVQPFWNTYYYLQEALQSQSPSVIVLDVYRALETRDYADQSRIAKNTFGMNVGIDKVEAKKVSSPEEGFLDYVLEFPLYHSRYADITSQDFSDHKGMKNRSSWKGFGINFTSKSLKSNPDVSMVQEREPLAEKTEEYLYRIIQLAKDSGIPLIMVCSPYNISAADQKKYNTVEDIANEQGIPFLNYNLMYEETGLDFSGSESDLASDSHLNHRGNIKYSKHLGQWLSEHYDIPDRRGDEAYSSWQIDADNNRALTNDQEIKETSSFSEWVNRVGSSDRFTAILAFKGNYSSSGFTKVSDSLRALGIETDAISGDAVFVIQNGEMVFSSGDEAALWHGETHSGGMMVESSKDGTIIGFAYDDYQSVANGVTAFLYDDFTGKLVEVVGWNSGSYTTKTAIKADEVE